MQFQTFLSPAKLNLGLKIVGKRQDGYHLLKSIFCLIDLYDKIDIQVTTNGKISLIEHNQAWFYQKDLAYKAAVLLQTHTATRYGANIRVKKLIPSGAGMGGGSSDAATVLMVLNHLWQTNIDSKAMLALGLELGADVPFFINGYNALVSGIGEMVEEVQLPQLYFVIIKPEFHTATRDIYTNLALDFSKIDTDLITFDSLLAHKENDLELVVKKLYPQINAIFSELSQYGTPVMTGSGSAIYLAFDDKISAKRLANILAPRYNTYLVASLPVSPVACIE